MSILLLALGLGLASPAKASERLPFSAVVNVGAAVLDCAIIAPGDKTTDNIDTSCENKRQAPGQVKYCVSERDYMCNTSITDNTHKNGAFTSLSIGKIEIRIY